MKEIKLTQGKVALVDDEDFERVNQYKWNLLKKKNGSFYARRNFSVPGGKRKTVFMHNFITGSMPGKGLVIDHKNLNTLDNTKQNFRVATLKQNSHNSRKHFDSRNKYKGVTQVKKTRKWVALLKKKHLGTFKTEEEAARAYDKEAKKVFGEFARTNFI